jgi:DNA-binding CsgD family transcriptional regulator
MYLTFPARSSVPYDSVVGEDSSTSVARVTGVRPASSAESLLERDAGLAEVEWLAMVAADAPAAVLIEGEAGIGKTTLWERGIELASLHRHQVLAVRPRPADVELPFLGLTELLDPIADRSLPLLPAPLARALRVLLFREEEQHRPIDRRTVFTAAARAIAAVAAEQITIIAIDDLQWLDAESAGALAFVSSRLRTARTGMLLARRSDNAPNVPPLELLRILPADRVHTIRLEPLTPRATRQLLFARKDLAAALPYAVRIHQMSGGNPFHALEIARLIASGAVRPLPGQPLPLPASVRSLVEQRLQAMKPGARQSLLAAALIARPTVPAVAAAAGADPALWVDQAVAAGLLRVELGRIAFAHPLFAAGVVDLALPEELRELHGRIAGIVDDPEERGVHLAHSAYPPDAPAADALEESAQLASRRGARLAAAERFHQSAVLTSADDAAARVRRLHEAAKAYRDAGRMPEAIAMATDALELVPAGPERASILLTMATSEAVSDLEAIISEALQHTGSDGALRARILTVAGAAFLLSGDLARASQILRAAASLAAAAGDAEAELRALGMAGLAGTLLVTPDAGDLLARALALEESGLDAGPWYSARHWLAVRALWHDELPAAIAGLELQYRRAEQEGNEFDQGGLTFDLVTAHCGAGNLAVAACYADIGYDLASQFGSVRSRMMSCAAKALTLAWTGATDAARSVAAEGIDAARAVRDVFYEVHLRSVVTFLEVSLGGYASANAASAGLPALVGGMGIRDSGVFPFAPDRIEALTALGQLDEAEDLTQQWLALGAELQRPRILATGARCRALCQAARGDLAGASEAAAGALVEHEKLSAPLELARTLLVYGRISRRLKQKSQARDALAQARSIFGEAGAPLWVRQTDAELARIGGRPAASPDLTASERRLAEAVASGATNREAADQLFLSVSTVEAMLSRVYRKLGVRSRTEMVTMLAAQPGSPSA